MHPPTLWRREQRAAAPVVPIHLCRRCLLAPPQGPAEEVVLESVPLEPGAMRREELDSRISWQINDLYKFFSQLYDKDQGEIA